MLIVLKGKKSQEISDIVHDLKTRGYKLGQDFDFEFSPGRYDYELKQEIPRQTKFTIYNSKLAIILALTWTY